MTRFWLVFVGCFIALPAGAAAPRERLAFSLDLVGHLPAELATVTPETAEVSLGALRPVLHEVSALYGLHVAELGTDLLLRTGYRFARGAMPEGSRVGNVGTSRYALDAVPVSIGLRSRVLPFRVQLLVGVDAGGVAAKTVYLRPDNPSVASGWAWQWEARLLAGAETQVWKWLSAALFVEGRLSQSLIVDRAPDLDQSGLGIGLSLSTSFEPPTSRSTAGSDTHDDTDLKQYRSTDPKRLEEAFALIREADEKAKKRDFIAAEELYRRALGMLPLDAETQRNVAAPVHVDWARALVEIGRRADAREALRRALEIAPDFAAARQMDDNL